MNSQAPTRPPPDQNASAERPIGADQPALAHLPSWHVHPAAQTAPGSASGLTDRADEATGTSQATSTTSGGPEPSSRRPPPRLTHPGHGHGSSSSPQNTTDARAAQLQTASQNDGQPGPTSVWIVQAGPGLLQAMPSQGSTGVALWHQPVLQPADQPMVLPLYNDAGRNSAPAVITAAGQAMPVITNALHPALLQPVLWSTATPLFTSTMPAFGRSLSSALDPAAAPLTDIQRASASIPEAPRSGANMPASHSASGLSAQPPSPSVPQLAPQPNSAPAPLSRVNTGSPTMNASNHSTPSSPVASPSARRRAISLTGRPTGVRADTGPRSGPAGVHVSGMAVKAHRLGHGIQHTSSSYLGVTWYKASKRWQARLCSDNKKYHLGYFLEEEEAARAYDRAVLQHKGPSAPRNFPDTPLDLVHTLARLSSGQLTIHVPGTELLPALQTIGSHDISSELPLPQVQRCHSAPEGVMSDMLVLPAIEPATARPASQPGVRAPRHTGMDIEPRLPSCPEEQPGNITAAPFEASPYVLPHHGSAGLDPGGLSAPCEPAQEDRCVAMEDAHTSSLVENLPGQQAGAPGPHSTPGSQDIVMSPSADTGPVHQDVSAAHASDTSLDAVMAAQAERLFSTEFVFVWDGAQLAASPPGRAPQQ